MVWFIDIDTQLALQGDNASLEKQLKEKKEENQKLKELLKECRYKIIADLDKARLCKSSVDIEDFEYMLNRIDEVLK
jgi:5-bromo-4-chloroindolyl phosphate hydrolysis protein